MNNIVFQMQNNDSISNSCSFSSGAHKQMHIRLKIHYEDVQKKN